jgi:hypothetical protein
MAVLHRLTENMAGISPDDSTTSLGKKGSSNRYRSNAPEWGRKCVLLASDTPSLEVLEQMIML